MTSPEVRVNISREGIMLLDLLAAKSLYESFLSDKVTAKSFEAVHGVRSGVLERATKFLRGIRDIHPIHG